MTEDFRTGDTSTVEGLTFEQEVEAQAHRYRVSAEARRVVAVEEAGREYPAPTNDDDGLLSSLLALPRRNEVQRIEGLMGMPHNAVVAAQYKTGKTTTGAAVVKAALDGLPFLDRKVTMGDGTVLWVNGEMDRDDFLDYLRPTGIARADRLLIRNMRGRRMNLLNDHVAEQFVDYLRANAVEWWWMDSWRVLCAWAGVNENRNEDVERLTARIDAIKHEANVPTFTALAHTGRSQVEDGAEHARGATALDDWQDARWVLTKAGQDRFLYVEGRGVMLPETKLVFDPATHLLSLGEGNRRQARTDSGIEAVREFVASNPGCKAGDLYDHLKGQGITQRTEQVAVKDRAVRAGLVHEKPGRGNSKVFNLGPDPEMQQHQQYANNLSGLSFEGAMTQKEQ